jgi:HK97 family phage portal protein
MGIRQWFKNIFNRAAAMPANPSDVRVIMVPSRHAGVHIDHDSALQFSAVFRAVSYISETIAWLPWNVLRETPTRRIKMVNHPVYMLLHTRPNPEMSAFDFRRTLIAWVLTWGNGYAEIERDGGGRPQALWPISPDRVQVRRNPDTRQIVYQINNYTGEPTYLSADKVFHVKGLGFDGLVGYSVISLAARSIGLSIAAESYAEDFFANGAVSTGALKHPRKLDDDTVDRLRRQVVESHAKTGKKWQPMVFEEGMDWVSLSIPSEDAQLIETRKFEVTDIARWYGLPPHKLQDLERATFSNIEHLAIEVINDALMPRIVPLEQEAEFKLFSSAERNIRTKINTTALLRGDNKARSDYYKTMREIGVYSTNRILSLEDEDLIGPEGDELLVPLNYTTLKKLVAEEPAQKPAPAPGPPEELPRAKTSFLSLFSNTFERILKREQGQFEQIKAKFNGNERLYNKWVETWLNPVHGAYIKDQIEPVIDSLVAVIGREKFNGHLAAIIERHIEQHLEQSRQELLIAFHQDEWPEIEKRAAKESENIIEHIVLSANGEYYAR